MARKPQPVLLQLLIVLDTCKSAQTTQDEGLRSGLEASETRRIKSRLMEVVRRRDIKRGDEDPFLSALTAEDRAL